MVLTSLLQGNCSESGMPDDVVAYFIAHPLAASGADKGSCSIYTQAVNATAPEVSCISFSGSKGRLFLSSIILNTIDPSNTNAVVARTVAGEPPTGSSDRSMLASNSTGPGKAAFGLSVRKGAQVWMTYCVVAFFGNSNIKAVDSHLFLIRAPPPQNCTQFNCSFIPFTELQTRDVIKQCTASELLGLHYLNNTHKIWTLGPPYIAQRHAYCRRCAHAFWNLHFFEFSPLSRYPYLDHRL